jgi:hypothetical protein
VNSYIAIHTVLLCKDTRWMCISHSPSERVETNTMLLGGWQKHMSYFLTQHVLHSPHLGDCSVNTPHSSKVQSCLWTLSQNWKMPWIQGCRGRRTPKTTEEVSTMRWFGIRKIATPFVYELQDTRHPNFVERPCATLMGLNQPWTEFTKEHHGGPKR